jgi:hypothetical protein
MVLKQKFPVEAMAHLPSLAGAHDVQTYDQSPNRLPTQPLTHQHKVWKRSAKRMFLGYIYQKSTDYD